jgi:pre-mRNA-splicing helicase BRR2
MLSFLSKYLGDVSQSTLKSACNSIIEILKSEEKDFDKKTQIQQVLLQDLLQDQFSILINLGKQITDYDPQQQPLDDQMDNDGVAVVFDDDESGDEEFEINDNVIEEDGEEADMNTLLRQGAVKEEVDEEMIDEFTTTLAAAAPNSKSDSKVNPKKIDAFWHQRLISIHYPEVQMAQAKASAAMDILCSDASFRDVENDLMALFDYEKFDLVKVLTVNRDALVWCTRLSKALSPEDRSNIINQMREIDLDWIIDELEGKVSSTEAMPMDIDKKEKATTATAMPKETVNLEALVFAQGGHLMTNKKCKLPEGTEKFSKKGYEEVHVPAPAHKPMNKNERLMKVSEMPEWVQPAFSGAQSLNRIQSRVYPIAFEDDENMLLCAPTGAGK